MGRFSIVRKKERWTSTWLGQVLKLILLLLIIYLYADNIVRFLAPKNPVNARILIVEGFIPDYAIEEAVNVFDSGAYQLMVITGKKRLKGSHLDIYANDGAYSAATLDSLGFDMNRVIVVPLVDSIYKNRTYYSAIAVKNWLADNKPGIQKADLLTIGCHGRRSKYLFDLAFEDQIEIGVISVRNKGYSPNEWWKSSYGFRDVIQETIAWIYARFFFFPAG